MLRSMEVFAYLVTTMLCFYQPSAQQPFHQPHEFLPSDHPQQEITYPSIVDSSGNHLSHNLHSLSGTERRRRHTTGDQVDSLPNGVRTYFKIDAFGQSLYLNVSLNSDFIHGSGPTVEYIQSNGSSSFQDPKHKDCFHVGHVDLVKDSATGDLVVDSSEEKKQWVSLSNCAGLRGLIATASGYILIQPVMSDDVSNVQSQGPWKHVVYRNTRSNSADSKGCLFQDTTKTVGSTMEQISNTARSKRQAEPLLEYFIETAIIADRSMLDYHGQDNLEAYLYTLMSIVHHLYRDPTIGQPISVTLARVIIFEDEPDGFSNSNIANTILHDFCNWQNEHRRQSSGPHYDIAVVITRNDICEDVGSSCGTLGMADLGSACDPVRSCNLNKDTGLSTSFTIAHELGHNIGLKHDGDPQLRCPDNSSNIMAPSFAESTNPHFWSACSRQQLEEILSNKESSCLYNSPNVTQPQRFTETSALPGMMYTPTEQCQLQVGRNASHCPEKPNECELLWCRVHSSAECTHKHSPPSPGTECRLPSGELGICYQGSCDEYDKVIEPRDGGWGDWGGWSVCSFTCGIGIQYRVRECDSPEPDNGGQYCLGPRKEYQTCNIQKCSDSSPDVRSLACQLNPPSDRYDSWKSASLDRIVALGLDMCHSHCVLEGSTFIYTMKYDLVDGTPCLMTDSPGVCVSGECLAISCNHNLGENSYRDGCGVWCGSGDSCLGVSGVFSNVSQDGHYVYYETITIPEGSVKILIQEVSQSQNNYIAVQGSRSGRALNGDLSVMPKGVSKFNYAGCHWIYERANDSPEYFKTDGPIRENLTVYTLANSMYDGIRYTFSIPNTKISQLKEPVYVWRNQNWGDCVASCEWGNQNRQVFCQRLRGIESESEPEADDFLCDPSTKPKSVQTCYTEPCVYVWSVTNWDSCDAICGDGLEHRKVVCKWIKRSGSTEIVNDTQCDKDTKPVSVQGCRVECVYEWAVTDWSECNVICGEGTQNRNATCEWKKQSGKTQVVSDDFCRDESNNPDTVQTCRRQSCFYTWATSDWGNCSSECGDGDQQRNVDCWWLKGEGYTDLELVVNDFCNARSKPPSIQQCNVEECVYVWTPSDWEACNVTVCGDGQQRRTVACQWVRKNENSVFVDDHFCHKVPQLRSVQDCQVDCVYRWTTGAWDSCDVICGRGKQQREIYCEWVKDVYNTEVVVNGYCNLELKPSSSQHCQEEECSYTWSLKEWSECDVDCGSGWKNREVICLWENLLALESGESLAIVGDEYCLSTYVTKPKERTTCESNKACSWDTSQWSECSSSCGVEGTQTRGVHCQAPDGNTVGASLCSTQLKPQDTRTCLDECPTVTCNDIPGTRICPRIVQLRYCKYKYYRRLCCVSCSTQ